jgi:hypothetical protein
MKRRERAAIKSGGREGSERPVKAELVIAATLNEVRVIREVLVDQWGPFRLG